MKIVDLTLNAIISLGVTIFVAYFAVRKGKGFFLAIPDGLAQFFMSHGQLQYVALGIAVMALLIKVPVVRTLKQRRAKIRSERR